MVFEKKFPYRNRNIQYYFPQMIKRPTDDLIKGNHLKSISARKHERHTIYVHIPFCSTICKYCPFVKVVKNDELIKKYIKALKKEIEIYSKSKLVKSMKFSGIYFGGGTPTVLETPQLVDIIKTIFNSFNIEENYEFTIEGTLSTFNNEKLHTLREAGINRISMGVQTFNEPIGKSLNLPQNQAIASQVINNAYNAGIKEINVDLMYNLPDQTFKIWEDDLLGGAATKTTHLALFPLIIKRNTALYVATKDKEELKRKTMVDENDFIYYKIACELLGERGFIQETPYDWSRKSHPFNLIDLESNEICDRLSLGVSSMGELNDIAYSNKASIPAYMEALENGELPLEVYGGNEGIEMMKYMMMRFKTLKVSISDFNKTFNSDIFDVYGKQLEKLQNDNLITIKGDTIALTRLGGFYYLNICLEYFIKEPYKSSSLMPAYFIKNPIIE